MSEEKGTSGLDGCRDTVTQLLVAIIGVAGIALGIVLENRSEIFDMIFPPPPSRVLVADFNDTNAAFSSDTITLRDCDTAVVSAGSMHVSPEIGPWNECRLAIRPKTDVFYNDLGSLEATFQVDDVTEDAESSAYLEMVTYFPGVILKAHCGMMQTQNKLFAFLSVKTVKTGNQELICDMGNGLNADGTICELWFDDFVELDRGEAYVFELYANPVSTNKFQCYANGADSLYWVDTNAAKLVADLSKLVFERYLIVGHTINSTASYTVDDIYEVR